jgi:hypothetical protein
VSEIIKLKVQNNEGLLDVVKNGHVPMWLIS